MGGGGRREKRGQGMGEHSIHVVCGGAWFGMGMGGVELGGLGWGACGVERL